MTSDKCRSGSVSGGPGVLRAHQNRMYMQLIVKEQGVVWPEVNCEVLRV